MIWFLIFCTTGFGSSHSSACIAPTQMPTESACKFTGRQMASLATDRFNPRFRCVGGRK